jgi:murein DD-endopeptidase MepM/ murein hydrolase activator NlpD
MQQIKFYYNPKSCRYEPSRFSVWRMLAYSFLFIAVTAFLLLSILFLHSQYFVTEKARALQAENKALKKHQASLQSELENIEVTLATLKQQEVTLHQKIFEAPVPQETETKKPNQANILLADASGFQTLLGLLQAKSIKVLQASTTTEAAFATMSFSKKDLGFLSTIPAVQPVENQEITKLVSGFGKRINPYHKGNYHHPGADFAAPRGTPVVATGNGKVIHLVKNSSHQVGYGNYVDVSHGNGLITRYAHLEEVHVKPGQNIMKGSTLGTVGMTGGSIAPHVHYEILRNGKPVNPVPYMMEGLSAEQYASLQQLGNKPNQSLD